MNTYYLVDSDGDIYAVRHSRQNILNELNKLAHEHTEGVLWWRQKMTSSPRFDKSVAMLEKAQCTYRLSPVPPPATISPLEKQLRSLQARMDKVEGRVNDVSAGSWYGMNGKEMQAAFENEDWRVRRSVVRTIGALHPEWVEHLLKDKDWRVRLAVVKAVGAAYPEWVEPLLNDEDEFVRAAVAKVLKND